MFDSFKQASQRAKLSAADVGGAETESITESPHKSHLQAGHSPHKRRRRKHWLPFGLCAFNRHRPIGETVRLDGTEYVGHCRKCVTPIRRIKKGSGRSKWVKQTDRTKE